MQKEFYSNGKLLLSGEYAILDGALGLAIPTKYGQSLKVIQTDSRLLEWTSLDEKGIAWFSVTFQLENLAIKSASDTSIAETLKRLLIEAKTQNPVFLHDSSGVAVETALTFPRKWGLGTSSTLINNMAQWAKIDAYQLLWNAFGGSGYDIACAQHSTPLLYQLDQGIPKVEKIAFDPPFKDSLFFVHLNQKQSSKEAIAAYRKQNFDKDKLISELSRITRKMVMTSSISEFEILITEHEQILSKVLKVPPVKSKKFPDYPGAIKSLGAWGGDFVLVTGDAETPNSFGRMGYPTVLKFSDLIL